MKDNKFFLYGLFIITLLFAVACNDNQPEKKITGETKKDTAKPATPEVETKKGPVINIGDTLSIKRLVLVMKDSASTIERVSLKLGEIYGPKLGAVMKKNNLKMTGAPMAWYKGQKAPYFFEAGIPIDKKPAKLPAGVYVKQIGLDSIVVAHFYGPYDLLPQAYEALGDWLKDHKKKSKGDPYEIYIGDAFDSTGKAKDPYKVQTDVVWPWK
ncbi:MAG: GyrI-like domain-containing protein [Ferruginibacter sp.]